ncbi:radical SAM protein [Streptomyces sp. NPDC002722]|uniref:radical SAM protein n=1 Tax=unclassified Streptomyces TaxID=2593676 RepID=UPI00332B5012
MSSAGSETQAELSAVDRERVLAMRNDVFHLILFPTEQCNFRCKYCYEDFSVGRMKPEVVEGVKRLVDNRLCDLRRLSVSWFGGEPLLASDVVESISKHIMAASRDSGLLYTSDMTTNGYMLHEAMLQRLTAAGVRAFQISLDGPEELHDHTRVRADGRGSFKRLWENLLAIRASEEDVRVKLRVHLTPDNISAMPDFLAMLRDTFLNDPRFSVKLKAVERLGGPGDASMNVLEEEDKSGAISRLKQIVEMPDRPELSEFSACYAARPNSLIVRANGKLGKCTVALSDEENDLGQLLPDGTLRYRNDRLRPWLRGWDNGDLSALYCPANGLTMGEPQLLQIGQKAR